MFLARIWPFLTLHEEVSFASPPTKTMKILNFESFAILTAANLSSNVEGNMFGKSLRATGSKNSMNGTITKTAKGTSLRRS